MDPSFRSDYMKDLNSRSMLKDFSPNLDEYLFNNKDAASYIGFDLTAPSLHVGNLATLMLLRKIQVAGYKSYVLLGGATSLVGDPEGKKTERKLLSKDEVLYNQNNIKKSISNYLDFDTNISNNAEIVNNYDWYKDLNIVDFLREACKYIQVSSMISKESVKRRIETGLSFAELSYQVLQAFDFLTLYTQKGVRIQMGGSDQWGNLTSGMELIRKKIGGEPHILTTPLITKSDGSKFGKSEQGNIWLDRNMTSPYKFYQFWVNISDLDSEGLIMKFTDLPIDEIHHIINEHRKSPEKRLLQKTLAKEITLMVHSLEDYNKAEIASGILFGKSTLTSLKEIGEETFLDVFEGVTTIELYNFSLDNISIVDFLSNATENKIFSSKGEARRFINSNCVKINKKPVLLDFDLSSEDLLFDKYLMVQKGKKNYFLVKIY